MAHILVVGGSGGIGLETVKLALERGHAVRAFARSASDIDLEHPQLEKFDGDALDADSVHAALDGVDAVVQSLGVTLDPGTVLGGTTLFSEATRVLLPAMQSAGVRRLIVVTGYGAGDSGQTMNPFNRLGFNAVFARIYADKSKQEAMIKASDLDWTIARPVVLTGGSHWEVGIPVVVVSAVATSLTAPAATWSVIGLLRFVPFFAWHSLRGGIDVAARALNPRLPIDPAIVDYDMQLDTAAARVLMANTVTLLPGTLSAELRGKRLSVHVLNASHPVADMLAALERRIAALTGSGDGST